MPGFIHPLLVLPLIFAVSIPAGDVYAINKSDSLKIISNLPLVIIQTNGQEIHDSKKIICHMGIIFNGQGKSNSIDEKYNNYNGNIAIEIRGSSSKKFPKKSYGVKTLDNQNQESDAALLTFPADNDWILYAPYNDKSLMRDVLAYKIANDLGHYASRTAYVELIINGSYEGIYILEEKIKRGKHRVNIADTGSVTTEGFILKIDRPGEGESKLTRKKLSGVISGNVNGIIKGKYKMGSGCGVAFSAYSNQKFISSRFPPEEATWQSTQIRFHDPEAENITKKQYQYLDKFIYDFESALICRKSVSDTTYRNFINVESFIDYFIINELTKNADSYRLSTYFYMNSYDKDGRLFMGPVWDFNISMGNVDYCNSFLTEGWAYEFNSECSSHAWLVPQWWKILLNDPLFTSELQCRWKHMRETTLKTSSIVNLIDSTFVHIETAQQRNFNRWPVLNKRVWPNKVVNKTYQEEIGFLKTWLTKRLEWIDNNMPGDCRCD